MSQDTLSKQGSINNISFWTSEKVKLNLNDEEERTMHKHFRHTGKADACDHCTYFKGIVWRTLNRRVTMDLDGLPSEVSTDTPTETVSPAPRSLESVALEEEAIEKAQHNAYLKWRASRTIPVVDVAGLKKPKVAYAADTASTTLRNFVNSSSKDDLLAWLRIRNPATDVSSLQSQSVLDIRDYILSGRYINLIDSKGKGKKRAGSDTENENDEPLRKTARKAKPVIRNVLLKPAGAADMSRELLQEWYEEKKAPELKAEVSRRGIRPLPSRKADLVAVLVEDDKPR